MWHYGFFWGFPFFPLVWFFFWILIIAFIFGPFRHHRHHWHTHEHAIATNKPAEDILRERFAKGEIDEKELAQRMDVLKAQA